METFEYNPKGVCSSKIIFNIDNNKILDAKIVGGCPGNSLGIRSLLKDQEIDYIIENYGIEYLKPLIISKNNKHK